MSLLELFCNVDDFMLSFVSQWKAWQVQAGRQRERTGQLCPSEVMTILIREVGGQRMTSAIDPEEGFSAGHYSSETAQLVRIRSDSNRPFPNRTGTFQRIRLSRCVFLPIGPHAPSRAAFSLKTPPCGPSPCPEHYPRHLSTMAAPSP